MWSDERPAKIQASTRTDYLWPNFCKHYTQPTHTSHSRTRDFSRVAQNLSHRVRIHSVSQNSHSSHLAQHVDCAYRREASADRPRVFSFFQKTLCFVHLTSETVQGNLPQYSHTKEGRVKKHSPTVEAFSQDVKHFEE